MIKFKTSTIAQSLCLTAIILNVNVNFDQGLAIDNSTSPNQWGQSVKWITYEGPQKTFTLKIPDGWEVKVDNKSGKIETYSYDNESLSIFPFFLPGKNIQETQSRSLFHALRKSMAEAYNQSDPVLIGKNGLKASSVSNNIKEVVSLVWKPTTNGTIGRFIIAKAPSGHSNHYSKVFTTILSSLRFMPPQNSSGNNGGTLAQQQQSTISWTKFVDPKQGAFSIDVPRGWRVDGGMEQPMAVDTRAWVRAVSPDQQIIILLGDATIPSYTNPTMQLTSLGFPPGSKYSPGYGFNTIVSYYVPAHKYVPNYGRRNLKKLSIKNIQLLGIKNHPNLARQLNQGFNTRTYSAVTCKFSGIANGKPVSAFFLGSTRKEEGLWYATLLNTIVSQANREDEAMRVYLHMYKSFQMNPNWQQGQLNLTKHFSRRMFQTWRDINQIMRDSYNYRSAIQDKGHRQTVNALRGTQDMVDPSTGTVYNVESGPNYHWINNDGYTTVGSNQLLYPGANWSRLVNVQ